MTTKLTYISSYKNIDIKFDSKWITIAMAEVITSGIGSVVSPIPRLITCASGYFNMCADLLLAI